jgi:hypothetical protein
MSPRNLKVCLWFCAALLASAEFIRAEKQIASETVLQKTEMFALGGIGVAGTMSEGERALREILGQPNALARLEALVSSGSTAGKLYALLGLRIILQQGSFGELVKEIERGQYDNFLAREWPEQAR